MMRQTISAEEFVAAVNTKMREHPGFAEGMSVELSPKVVISPIGTQVRGPLPQARSVATWAQKVTLSHYKVVTPH